MNVEQCKQALCRVAAMIGYPFYGYFNRRFGDLQERLHWLEVMISAAGGPSSQAERVASMERNLNQIQSRQISDMVMIQESLNHLESDLLHLLRNHVRSPALRLGILEVLLPSAVDLLASLSDSSSVLVAGDGLRAVALSALTKGCSVCWMAGDVCGETAEHLKVVHPPLSAWQGPDKPFDAAVVLFDTEEEAAPEAVSTLLKRITKWFNPGAGLLLAGCSGDNGFEYRAADLPEEWSLVSVGREGVPEISGTSLCFMRVMRKGEPGEDGR